MDTPMLLRRRSNLPHIATVALSLAACTFDAPDQDDSYHPYVEGKVQELAAYTDVTLHRPNHQVPVCFLEGPADARQVVQAAVEATWERYSRLDFTGWGDCPASPSSETITVRLRNSGWTGGVAAAGVGGRLGNDTQVEIDYRDPFVNLRSNSVHEFGHAIGFPHEQQRNDHTSCFWEPDPNNPDAGPDQNWDIIPDLYRMSPYDPNSIMNYCRDLDRDGLGEINGGDPDDVFELSNMDRAGVALLYGRRPGAPVDAAFAWVPSGNWSSSRPLEKPTAFNSAGSFNEGTVSRSSTGVYTVVFSDLGGSAGGNVQVTATDRNRCVINGWSGAGGGLSVTVRCFNASNALANTGFSLSYVRRYPVANAYRFAEGGYLWYSGSSTPLSTYSWNSLGLANSVARTAVGRYTATFDGQAPFGSNDGTAEVTAYGTSAVTCKIGDQRVSGNNMLVDVLCFAGASAADSNFSLRYNRHITGGTPSAAYAWANNPSTTALYSPPSGRAKVAVSRGDGTHYAPENAVLIERTGTGKYSVRFNGLPSSTDERYLYMKGHAQVTAYGTDSGYCTLGQQRWEGINLQDVFVTISCYTSSGTAADSRFNVTFASSFSNVGPTIALKWFNKYVMAANAGSQPLIATANAVGEWERFALISNPDSTVSLLALVNRRYVTAENAGNSSLIARATEIREWEQFRTVKNGDGTTSFIANINGKYVCTEDGFYPLIANRTAIGDWEKFRLEIVEQ